MRSNLNNFIGGFIVKRLNRFLGFVCTISILITTMAGCGTGSTADKSALAEETQTVQSQSETSTTPKDVSLRFMWWGGEARHKATVAAVDKFMEKYPNIKVGYEYSGFQGYFDKLLTQYAAGTAPDVMQLSYTNAGEYVMRKQLFPLDEFQADGTLNVSNLAKSSVDMYRIDGKSYALPLGIGTIQVFYNKDVFDKYGVKYPDGNWSWPDYANIAKELTKDTNGDGKTDLWGTGRLFIGGVEPFQKMIYERGGKMWNEGLTKVAFNSPEGIAALSFEEKLLKDGYMPEPEITASNPQGVDDFQLGRVAMQLNVGSSTQAYADNVKFKFGIVRMPASSEKKAYWLTPTVIVAINKNTKGPKESAMLIDYLLNDEVAAMDLKVQRGIPPNPKIREIIAPTLSEYDKEMLAAIEAAEKDSGDVQLEPYPPGYLEIVTEFVSVEDSVLYGKITPEEALKQLEESSNKIIDKFYNK